jgi:hypothetical protein
MVRRFPGWIAAAALAGGIACTQAAPVQTPDQVVSTFIAAAEKGDWGTADSYLTERFSNALRPGSLPSIWGTVGENVQVRNQEVSGKTAYVWVEGHRLSGGCSPASGAGSLDVAQVFDPAGSGGSHLSAVGPAVGGDAHWRERPVTSRVKITLYQQDRGWRIEVWQPDKPPAASGSQSENPEETEAADPGENSASPTENP